MFVPPIVHPNIDKTGMVALDIFKEWRPSYLVRDILFQIQEMLNERQTTLVLSSPEEITHQIAFVKDTIVLPLVHANGSLNLFVWECIIPDVNQVKFETYIEILHLKQVVLSNLDPKNLFVVIKNFYFLKKKLLN